MARRAPGRRFPGVYVRELADGTPVHDIRYTPRNGDRVELRGVTNADGSYANAAEALEIRTALLATANAGTRVPLPGQRRADDTLETFAEGTWLPSIAARVKRGELRGNSTADKYHREWRNHIRPTFGTWLLSALGTPQGLEAVCDWRDALSEQGLSNDSVKTAMAVLGTMLTDARRRGRMLYNPVDDAAKPKARRRAPKLPTRAEVEALVEAVPTAYMLSARLPLVLYLTGVRPSELYGLRWEHVDLTEGHEAITLVEQFYKGEWINLTKTEAGNREHTLGPLAAHVLKEQAAHQALVDLPNPLGLVFPGTRGAAWRDSNYSRRCWQPAREAIGRPDLTPYAMRYAYRTLMLNAGISETELERQMGHSDRATARAYTVPTDAARAAAREAAARAFGGLS
jgi:integrase